MQNGELSAAEIAKLSEIEGAAEIERLQRTAELLSLSRAAKSGTQPIAETDPAEALRKLSEK